MPVPTGPVHAQMTDNSSRADFAVSRCEFVEIGASTCDFTGTPAAGCTAFCDLTGIAGLHVMYEYSMVSAAACCCTSIPIFRRLIDETHAQRH